MKLLLDQNLPRSLCRSLRLSGVSWLHVANEGLDKSIDRDVWVAAREGGFVIVSKDRDFADMSVLYGPPPKVIWLRLGNCSIQEIEQLLKESEASILEFVRHPDAGLLVLPNRVSV
ncbi:MAG TPA: DUF5615 family PIN-like protein [Fimbriimonadaceae bacterium]|nr:DUF5615 family PIN-like protein [Fimbriimonadaceae bacterium]